MLLRAGATRVYAVDVGYGQLSWKLRTDPRVVVYERTNVRYLNDLPERASLVVADLSFISLTLVLGRLIALAEPDADFILLVKPQFEAEQSRGRQGRRGSRPRHTPRCAGETTAAAETHGLQLHGATASPILGPAGNVEFLAWYSHGEAALEPAAHLDRALAEAATITRLKPDDAPTPGSAPDPANATHGAA
ncbi:MAG: SAM-dependent methyltransferase [Chloroflexia bacterium]